MNVQTTGADLFVDKFGQIINISPRWSNHDARDRAIYLKRIDHDAFGAVIVYFLCGPRF